MKRIFVVMGLVGLFMLSSADVFSQYKKGDNLVNLGFGLNSYYSGGIPFCAAYENGVSRYISVGGEVDYFSYHYGVAGYDYHFNAIYLSGRVSYHFNELLNIAEKKLDIYGGGSLGYRSYSDNYSNNGGVYYSRGGYYSSGFFLGIHAGARYYFAPKVGAFSEIGALGSSNIKVGITFRF
jgi:hypothetical protein